jgi:hypothetical protein
MLDPRGGWSPGDALRGAVSGVKNIVAHPLDTLAGMAQPFMASGVSPNGYPTTAATGRPQDSQANAQVQQQAQQGQADAAKFIGQNPAYAIGQVAGPAIATAGVAKFGPKIAGAAMDAPAAVKSYLRPTSSPSVVARSEFAARKLSAAVLPADKDASNFIKAAQEEIPNVLDYAKRTGNPLNTQLEFSKAAQGYAQDVLDLKNSIEAPVQNKVVKTTGSGFGDRMQEGPDTFATVGAIDKRITAINDELRAPRLNAGDSRAALAGTQDLQQEASRLRTILHKELADASGLTPDDISQIRQRAGRAYELANDTDAAVTKRMQAEGKTDMGPLHLNQLPSRAIEFARGGTVAVADRAFQRAIANFPGQSSPLPSVSAPTLPTAPIDRLQQLVQDARQQQSAVSNKFRLSQATGLPADQLDKVINALRGQF